MVITQAGSSEATGAEGMFGMLDIFVISGVAGLVLYWFVFKKKKEEELPNFKPLKPPTVVRSESYDPSFVSKMKRTGRNVVIFYGSQTGTAEEFAVRLAKDANRYGMKGMAVDPEECSMEDLVKLNEIENSIAIFCMATYGEGDPTDNAQEFYDWLQEGTEDMGGLRFTVFGLGNKTYEHYNSMGIFVDKRLEELGGERLFDLGLGDDDSNIEEDFITWKEKFWPAVCEKFGITSIGEDVSIRQYSVEEHDDVPTEKQYRGEPARLNSFVTQKPPFEAKNPFLAPITVNRELHKCKDRSCMHIEFDITGSRIRYDAGDHVAVYPTNDAELVQKLGERIGADLDVVFSLNNVDEDATKKHPFPCPTTYRTALLHYLDITHIPRTNVLKELVEYAEEEKDKTFLLSMTASTPEAKELYNDWIIKDHRTILALLEDLPSVKPPIDHVCEMLPRLQARYYSISSSPKVDPNIISITAVLVDWNTRTGRQQKGVATSWLSLKHPVGEDRPRVPIFVRKSQFRLPFKTSVPVMMIGPGTGVAPFRGFIQDRHMQMKDGKNLGETILYFGCRRQTEDFIYEDELQSWQEDGTLSKLYTAFSRDQDKKVYVQNLLGNNADEVWRLLEQGGHIYVCGDARHMAPDVDHTLQDIVSTKGDMDKTKAQEYLKKMRSRGRYSCDVWS